MNVNPSEPMWGVVANIVRERRIGASGKETRIGTRKFHGGAKVYIAGAYWGMGGESVIVIGRFRGRNWIRCVINAIYLENFRVKLIYSPTIIGLIKNAKPSEFRLMTDSDESKVKAQELAEIYARSSEYWVQQRLLKWAKQRLVDDEVGNVEDE